MRIVQINSTYGIGSTGKICKDISEMISKNGIENYTLYTIGNSEAHNAIKCSNKLYTKAQALKSKLLGNYGFNSKYATKKIIRELDIIKPDILHLHNIHSHDCNLEMLFDYFRRTNQKLIWTFHDCWPFTAYCPHFTMAKCDKWKSGCHNCSEYNEYSFVFDRSDYLFRKKKGLFTDLDMTIITPSQWLADLVKQSFLGDYPVYVINNGIDLSVFKPTQSDVRRIYKLRDKKIILGVAFGWGKRKGLDIFNELAARLDETYYCIVLVGTDDSVDKQLAESVISIHRTNNQQELAALYSASDVLINPTREENFPTVNIESLACGTPVITFNTGGSPEIIDQSCGSVVDVDDIDSLEQEIIRVCEKKSFSEDACVTRAKLFNKNELFQEYIKIYIEANNENYIPI